MKKSSVKKMAATVAMAAGVTAVGYGQQVHADTVQPASDAKSTVMPTVQAASETQHSQQQLNKDQTAASETLGAVKHQTQAVNQASDAVKSDQGQVASAQTAVDSASQQVSAAQSLASQATSEGMQNVQTAVSQAQKTVNNDQDQLNQLKSVAGNFDSTLLQKDVDQKADVVKSAQTKVANDRTKIGRDQSALKNTTDAPAKIKEAQGKIQQSQKLLHDATNSLNRTQAELSKAKQLVAERQKEAAYAKGKLADVQKKVDNDQVAVKQAQAKVDSLSSTSAKADSQKLNALKQQQQDAQKALEDAQDKLQADQTAHQSLAKQLSDLQDKVAAAQKAADSASQAYANAQQKLNQSQQVLKDQQAQLASLQDGKTVNNMITVPAGYVQAWKDYLVQKKNGAWDLSQQDYPALYKTISGLDKQAAKMNSYREDNVAKQTKVVLNANGTLSRDDIIKATQFAIHLVNPLRQAIGTTPYSITNASIDIAREVANGYREDHFNMWTSAGHDNARLDQVANEWGTSIVAESWAGDGSFGKTTYDNGQFVHHYDNLTLNDLYRGVYDSVVALLFKDADQNYGHTTDLLGVRAANSDSIVGEERLGVSFDYGKGDQGWGQINVGGFHFDSIADKTSPHLQNLAKQGFVFDGMKDSDKVNQPEYIKEIPLVASTGDNSQKVIDLNAKIAKSKSAVADAQQAQAQAKQKADQANVALNQAKDKLNQAQSDSGADSIAKDQQSVKDAQNKVDDLNGQVKTAQQAYDQSLAAESMQKQNLKNANDALHKAQDQLASDQEALKSAQKFNVDDQAELKLAQDKVDRLNAQIAKDKNNIKNAQNDIDQNKQTIATLQKALMDKDAVAKDLKANQDVLEKDQQALKQAQNDLDVAKAKLSEANDKQSQYAKQVKDAEAKLAQDQEMLADAKQKVNDLKGADQKLADAKATLKAAQDKLANLQAQLAKDQKTLDTASAKLAALKSKLAEQQKVVDQDKAALQKAQDHQQQVGQHANSNGQVTLGHDMTVKLPNEQSAGNKGVTNVSNVGATGQANGLVNNQVAGSAPVATIAYPTVNPTGNKQVASEDNKLPQTGNDAKSAAVLSMIGLSSLLSMFGFAKKRHAE